VKEKTGRMPLLIKVIPNIIVFYFLASFGVIAGNLSLSCVFV